MNPERVGTKAAAHYRIHDRAGRNQVVRLWFGRVGEASRGGPLGRARANAAAGLPAGPRSRMHSSNSIVVLRTRRREADEFYAEPRTVLPERRTQADPPPGARGHALEQTVLSLHHRGMARGRSGPAASAAGAQSRPQRRVAPPLQRAGHVDAGQMGISLVRRLGPGLPLHPAGAGRSAFRQGPARYHPARMVPASQRPDPRLRMEFQRR